MPETEPLKIRVRDSADMQAQINMHNLNALAASFHRSRTLRPLTAAQPSPHAQARADYTLSSDAQRYEQIAAEIARLNAVRPTLEPTDWEALAANDDKHAALTLRAELLHRQLSGDGGSRGERGGVSNLWVVTVPSLGLSGGVNVNLAPRRYLLDTHALPDGLHQRLTTYLHCGTVMLPFRVSRERYKAESKAADNTRELLASLWRYVRPDGRVTRTVAPVGEDRVYCC